MAILLAVCTLALLAVAQLAAATVVIMGKVVDENGAPVKGAHIVALAPGVVKAPLGGGVTSDAAGLFRLEIAAEGIYQVRADREGYFEFRHQNVNLDPDSPLEIQLNHLKELAESVDVRYSAPVIDPEQTSDAKRLQAPDILNVPYPASQDYRSALPMLSGAIQDNNGQVHFNGGRTSESNYRLNGFDVADPATGNLTTRLNVDTVQTLEFEASRFSPERGKGSAGTLEIQTQMGDDHWRFGGTNFIPGIGTQGGAYLNHWSPRVIVSGPIRKGRAWFHDAFDTFYAANTVSGLPSGQNRTSSISGSNLSRFQWNIRDTNILTGSLLVNLESSNRNGLSFLNPAETTVNRRRSLFLATVKDQWIVGGGLIEFGFADTRAYLRGSPQGSLPYIITPFGAVGNYFRQDQATSARQEWLVNGFVKPLTWHGSHQIEAGANVERSDIYQTIFRHDLEVVRS
ncbi:MAG: carboxypeptidase-like regulatory domain-containing protein, partial [Acidobacteriota bacterium]|nr:carboxypeptidase-like regulatory domain-containing protein [Acidobacteriota bacterium]